MADMRDLEAIRQGVEHWNTYVAQSTAGPFPSWRADLGGANLAGADLAGADLARVFLPNADLAGADLARANLSDANLSDADLAGADLTGANLTGANLIGANLTGANLIGANLSDADLAGANLTLADLLDANLTRANLTRADLTGANLTSADMRRIKADEFVVALIAIAYRNPDRAYPPRLSWPMRSRMWRLRRKPSAAPRRRHGQRVAAMGVLEKGREGREGWEKAREYLGLNHERLGSADYDLRELSRGEQWELLVRLEVDLGPDVPTDVLVGVVDAFGVVADLAVRVGPRLRGADPDPRGSGGVATLVGADSAAPLPVHRLNYSNPVWIEWIESITPEEAARFLEAVDKGTAAVVGSVATLLSALFVLKYKFSAARSNAQADALEAKARLAEAKERLAADGARAGGRPPRRYWWQWWRPKTLVIGAPAESGPAESGPAAGEASVVLVADPTPDPPSQVKIVNLTGNEPGLDITDSFEAAKILAEHGFTVNLTLLPSRTGGTGVTAA